MQEVGTTYKESGKFGATAPVLLLIGGIIGAAILGFLYGVATFYIPLVFINFFITLFFGFGVGFVVSRAGKMGNSRSGKLNTIMGLVAGLAAFYFAWVFWIYALSEWKALVLNPVAIFEIQRNIATEGAWSIFSITPKGFFLWLIWIIEAGMIVLLTLAGANTGVDDVFCDRCNKWVSSMDLNGREINDGTQALIEQLKETGNTSQLAAQPVCNNEDEPHLHVSTESCAQCDELHALTVGVVSYTVDDEGNAQKQVTPVVARLMVTAADRAALG